MNFEEFNKHSGSAILPEDVDLMAIEFKPLKEFVGKAIIIRGFFFSNGKFGEQVSVYAKPEEYRGGVKINMPKRYVETFRAILNTEGSKEAILNGKCMMTNIHEVVGKQGKSISFDFKDC